MSELEDLKEKVRVLEELLLASIEDLEEASGDERRFLIRTVRGDFWADERPIFYPDGRVTWLYKDKERESLHELINGDTIVSDYGAIE